MSEIEGNIIKARHPFSEASEMFFKNYAAVVALIVLCSIVLMAIFGPAIYPVDPFDMVWICLLYTSDAADE